MTQLTVNQWVNSKAMAREYAGDFGDQRLTRRAMQLGAKIARKPDKPFPKLFVDDAELEAHYRLMRNPAVSWVDFAAPHASRTVDRAVGEGEVLVVHDTTDVTLRTYWTDERRRHMSKFTSRSQGFLAHGTVAVTAKGMAMPLGLLRLQPFVHRSQLSKDDAQAWEFWKEAGGLFDNERQRWFEGVAATGAQLAARGVQAVHVADCETDSYGLLSWLVKQEHRFVVRSAGSRRLDPVDGLRDVGLLQVQLGQRFDLSADKNRATHPPRRSRTAQLTVRAGLVRLRRTPNVKEASWSPGGYKAQPKTLQLHLVEAVEANPPEGEQGVHWQLLTTEPIDTAADVLRVIELYRRRWLIEEFFKALKTGCRLEARQSESAETMLRVLAMLVPAAWRLLLLRSVAAEAPDTHWSHLLTPLEFQILRRAVPKAQLAQDATAEQCLLAIARLGGHLKRNGRPGWQTLHLGWQQLSDYVEGALLAKDVINA
jgi:Transposase DNA-binding/Transposase DDE domain